MEANIINATRRTVSSAYISILALALPLGRSLEKYWRKKNKKRGSSFQPEGIQLKKMSTRLRNVGTNKSEVPDHEQSNFCDICTNKTRIGLCCIKAEVLE